MKTFLKIFLVMPLFAVAGCLLEPFEIERPCPCDDEKSVTLRLSVPYIAPKSPATRSIGEAEEIAIETLDVLAFKVEGGVETFLYWAEASRIADKEHSFNAMLRVGDFSQRFVLVSNARSKIASLIGNSAGQWVGKEKEEMLQHLTFGLEAGNDSWKAISAADYTALPMWGETSPEQIKGNTTAIAAKVTMLRMVAKIEVELTNDDALRSAFQLTSVHVYNTNTSGRVVPKPGAEYVNAEHIAQKASLPNGATMVTGPVAYSDFSDPGKPNIAMKGLIYLFETAAKNAGNFLNETCIVVGGIYNGAGAESFYRLDFFEDDGATHRDILRNHLYRCNITAVNGPGSNTVDDAYRSKPFDMEAEIIPWDENKNNVIFDGQYLLNVSQNPFVLESKACTESDADNILYITTNYPTGWTASVWADPYATTSLGDAPWLGITPPAVGTGSATPVETHLLATANPHPFDRTAYIHIKAGALTYVEKVVQKGDQSTIIGGGEPPAGTTSYVGAFWRANEKGERIIRIKMDNNPANLGAWTATAMWMDDRWGSNDGVLLDADMLDAASLAARGISFTSTMNPDAYGSPESYPVTGSSASVTGTVSGEEYIEFRIGLKTTYTPTASHPARYAVVVLSYHNNTKHQKIFLRQGEGPDYAPGKTSGPKWSPYNLGNTNDRSEYSNGGFVDYPTKAGYYYQFGYGYTPVVDEKPIPYAPSGSISITKTGGNGNELYALGAAAPAGYTLPSGGDWVTPSDAASVYNKEGAWGYYADGWFDRREIVNSPTDQPNAAVSITNNNVAYLGALIYNTTTNASLFFPAAGQRKPSDGSLFITGSEGSYFTRTYYGAQYAYNILVEQQTSTSGEILWGSCTRKYIYSLRCIQDHREKSTISLDPAELYLPTTIAAGTTYAITVTCKKPNGDPDPNAEWTLHSADPSWCKLSKSPGTAFGSAQGYVYGTGTQTVYLMASNNTGNANTRVTTVYVDEPAGAKTSVVQWCDIEKITDGGDPPAGSDVMTYVGAFWRAGEKGERIIRIHAGQHNTNLGEWAATVIWMDEHWNHDDILLDTDKLDNASLLARGINFSAVAPDASVSPAESHPVTGNSATVGGVLDDDGYIMFRIGLKTTYNPSTARPARYAVLLLSYAGHTRSQKIFLRQGEGADYLMHPNDAVGDGLNLPSRPYARKFAAYNLTAETLNAPVPPRGAKFTEYPSQGGSYFYWAHAGERKRYAWDSYTVLTHEYVLESTPSTPTDYNKLLLTRDDGLGWTWEDIKDEHETSPQGFRRPNEKRDNSNSDYDGCEFSQSLFVKNWGLPSIRYHSNRALGYYADGFFDRRMMVAADPKYPNYLASVSLGADNIAHMGALFFNPDATSSHYNASLFFPYAGYRLRVSGNPNFDVKFNDACYWAGNDSERPLWGVRDGLTTSAFRSGQPHGTIRPVSEDDD